MKTLPCFPGSTSKRSGKRGAGFSVVIKCFSTAKLVRKDGRLAGKYLNMGCDEKLQATSTDKKDATRENRTDVDSLQTQQLGKKRHYFLVVEQMGKCF